MYTYIYIYIYTQYIYIYIPSVKMFPTEIFQWLSFRVVPLLSGIAPL